MGGPAGVGLGCGEVSLLMLGRLLRVPPLSVNALVPSCAVSSDAAATVITAFSVTFTFSEPVVGFVVGDITVSNGTAGTFAGSGTTYTATITPTADGTVSVSVAAGVCQDASGASNTASNTLTRTADITAPSCVLSSDASEPIVADFTLTVTFSEAVTGFAVGDITASGCTLSGFTAVSTSVYSVTVSASAAETMSLQVGAGVCTDLATNPNTVSNTLVYAIAYYTTTFAGAVGTPEDDWTGTFTRDGSGNLAPAVTVGETVLVNGTMETGDPPSSWTPTGATLSAAADERTGGSGSQSLNVARNGANYIYGRQSATVTVARFYRAQGWRRNVDVTSTIFELYSGALGQKFFCAWSAATVWAFESGAILNPAASILFSLAGNAVGLANGTSCRADDCALGILSDVFASVTLPTAYGSFSVPVTAPLYNPAGVKLNYTDADNVALVELSLDRSKIQYIKVVAGVVTVVGEYAITYGAGTAFNITRHQDGTLDIAYGAISLVTGAAASGLTGLDAGLIATENDSTSFASFTYDARGVT